MSPLMTYLKSESGAITVDWVVLTAAIASLALAVVLTVGTPAVQFGRDIGDHVSKQSLLQY